MALYSRAQLKLLLALAAVLLVGIGVREWRAGFPELAERLEGFDREEASAPVAPAPPPERRASSAATAPAPGPIAAAAAAEHARPDGPPIAGAPAIDQARPDPAPVASGDRPLDLNRATAAELARLPGVGPTLADRIMAERERRGRFESPDALRAVLGMGPKKLAAIRGLVTVEQ